MSIPTQDFSFDEFVYLRGEIRGHHEMINHRMSWFAATQSLLYGAYASAIDSTGARWFSERLIPSVGILLCVLMVPAVESAFERVRKLRKVLKSNMTRQFRRIYPVNPDIWHGAAHLYPRFAPWIFLASWCLVLWKDFRH